MTWLVGPLLCIAPLSCLVVLAEEGNEAAWQLRKVMASVHLDGGIHSARYPVPHTAEESINPSPKPGATNISALSHQAPTVPIRIP